MPTSTPSASASAPGDTSPAGAAAPPNAVRLGPAPPAAGLAPDDAAFVNAAPVRLTVRYFAGARAAAGGVSAEPAEANSLDELTQLLANRHGERLAVVLKAASFLVDGLTCHNRAAPLPANATVDVLPPFAGG